MAIDEYKEKVYECGKCGQHHVVKVKPGLVRDSFTRRDPDCCDGEDVTWYIDHTTNPEEHTNTP